MGVAETFVGELLAGRRERTLLATKARFIVGTGPNDGGSSRHHLVDACEASLRRLQTEHIDLSSFTNGTGRPRWRRRSEPSTSSCGAERSATWGAPTSPVGKS